MQDAGETALLYTTLVYLNKKFPDAELVAGLTSEQDVFLTTLPNIVREKSRFVRSPSLKTHPMRVLALVLLCLPEYITANLVIDIGADGFSDGLQYRFLGAFSHASQILAGVLFGKQVFVCAQSIGPFKSRLTQFLGFFVLNKVNLITTREKITRNYLSRLGVVNPPVLETADLAFLLEPTLETLVDQKPPKMVHAKRPLIGISLSQIIGRWAFPYLGDQRLQYQTYILCMQEITNYVIERYDADVLFVLHTVGKAARHDDRLAAQKTLEGVSKRERIRVVSNAANPAKVKQTVGECELFIASKMHTAVEATTMLVPTVSIAYNYKVHGIIGGILKQDNLIVDIETCSMQEFMTRLKAKVDYAWMNREEIRDVLREETLKARRLALTNFDLAESLVRRRCR